MPCSYGIAKFEAVTSMRANKFGFRPRRPIMRFLSVVRKIVEQHRATQSKTRLGKTGM